MTLYGIRTRIGARLLGVAAATTAVDDGGDGLSMERSISVVASVVVGDFARGALFCTDDAELAEILVATGRGRRVGDSLSVRPPFGMTLDDLEVVDLGAALASAAARPHEPAQLPDGVVPLHPPVLAAA